MGSSTREYVGFLVAILGAGSLFSPSAVLNAQLLTPPLFFFLRLTISVADSFEEVFATTNL